MMPGIGEFHGIFVSSPWPLDENEGPDGEVVLVLDILEELFVKYEHVEEGCELLMENGESLGTLVCHACLGVTRTN